MSTILHNSHFGINNTSESFYDSGVYNKLDSRPWNIEEFSPNQRLYYFSFPLLLLITSLPHQIQPTVSPEFYR